jgi:putative hydrolase of the HAD superfamily
MTAPRCFLVDLDDTLFAELDYVDSGYRAISSKIATETNASADDVLFRLRYELRKFGRVGAFDRVLSHFNSTKTNVSALVAAYRDHEPDIQFYPGARNALIKLRALAPIAIVTDGTAAMQRRKIETLQLKSLVDTIVYCWECQAPKPAILGYEIAAEQLGCEIKNAIIIGDDPLHDMAAAALIGARSIRVRTGRFRDLDGGDAEEFPDFATAVSSLVSE